MACVLPCTAVIWTWQIRLAGAHVPLMLPEPSACTVWVTESAGLLTSVKVTATGELGVQLAPVKLSCEEGHCVWGAGSHVIDGAPLVRVTTTSPVLENQTPWPDAALLATRPVAAR